MKYRTISRKLEVLSAVFLMFLIYKNVRFWDPNLVYDPLIPCAEDAVNARESYAEIPEEYKEFCPPELPGGYVFSGRDEGGIGLRAQYRGFEDGVLIIHRRSFDYTGKLNGLDDEINQIMEQFYEDTQGLQIVYFKKTEAGGIAWVDSNREYFYFMSSPNLDETSLKEMADSIIGFIGDKK